jgi:DNA polymerase-3 subunit gamma/tau
MIALARKYRPKRFADLLVQDHVATALRGAVARGRVGHGYLLTGPRGTGKTTAARILAMALNCEKTDPKAPTGRALWRLSQLRAGSGAAPRTSMSWRSTRPATGASTTRATCANARCTPRARKAVTKVYIVDEAHMLTREAWNALLKILEEPPPGVVFVFATTEPQKIASTAAPVLSRLQRFDFRRIGPAAIRDRLRHVLVEERLSAEEDALTLIARYADGGMRDALSVLDQCLSFGEGPITAAAVREVLGLIGDDQYAEVLRLVMEKDSGGVFPAGGRAGQCRCGPGRIHEWHRGAAPVPLMVQSGAAPEGLTETLRQAIDRAREVLQPADAVRMLSLLAEAETSIRRSASVRLVVETLLLRWTLMDRVVELEQVIAGMTEGKPGGTTALAFSRPPVLPSTGRDLPSSRRPVSPRQPQGSSPSHP